ncbi:hypothetical protein [Paraclostridium dentum]|uniref:hypothetical protein n=1 Tax=Paraclostridium dentum TaxID=2662455 RepID=UPI003F3F3E77
MASTGIFDNDLILPGVITEIIPDYAQDYDTSAFGTTESVTIIGTAFNGPVGRVVPIYSPEHAKYIFGDSFDPATRREASLVAEVYDAWERGCRTIYGIRVSGKEICKDYEFATETKLKLRVSGIFPSNDNKEVFMNFVSTQTANGEVGSIKVYKPSNRSNMKEKMQGLVLNQNQMLVTDIKLAGYGITKDSRLVDVINIVNNTENNNVLRLAIVNENGADVTTSSKEAQSLSLGVMFPGIYTIGRDKVAENVITKTELDYILSKDAKPHANYQESVWKELIVNSDVAAAYPLFAKSNGDLNSLFPGITTDIAGEWLKPIGAINKISQKNNKDYEEVELDEFDLYNRLGSGFAQTAQVVEVKNNDGEIKGYKVAVPNSNDVNRVQEIPDGIYSMLQNHSTDYTVMSNANAETKITGKLPRKESFKKRKAGTLMLKDGLANVIELSTKIDDRDFSEAKEVEVEIIGVEVAMDQEEILANLDTTIKAKRVECIRAVEGAKNVAASFPEGTIVIEASEDLYVAKQVVNKELVILEGIAEYLIEEAGVLKLIETDATGEGLVKDLQAGVTFIAVNKIANVYAVGALNKITPVSVLGQIANAELDEDYTVCFVEDLASKLTVKVFSTEAQWMNYDELVSKLNEDEIFSTLFLATALTPDVEVASSVKGKGLNKGDIFYDTSLYIPYTTSDNFARHLAQHCLYTSLKTYPTHGVMGCSKLNGVNLSTVAERVNQILELDLDLYAKRGNGNNMLNNNNVPHPIGRCLSVPFMQYTVTTGNGYNYVSNGSAGYAGMVSTLPADRSSTNQPISIGNLSFELSNYQLSKLTGKGIVTVKRTTQGLVVTDGITMAPVDSAYRRLSTAKVINIVDKSLRRVIEPYIGLQDNLATKNSLNTAITSVLNKLKESLISYYKFDIVTDPASAKLGIIKIQYTILPTNEIKEVRNTVSVQQNN